MSILDRFSLKGRSALVTGAGRGIGNALAQALAEAGADVACADIDGDSAQKAAGQLAALGVRTLALETDVTNRSQVDDMVQAVVAAWDKLDIGVNCAGIVRSGKAEEMTEDDWDAVLDVNLKGVFLCCQAEAGVMLPRSYGKIINIGSMSASIVNRPQNQVGYNASKAGVVHLTRTCAAEWAPRGVRVNCISPGYTVTPLLQALPEELVEVWKSYTPTNRIGTPQDLQGATVYLASEASDCVTGHDLIVDGGYVLW
jgi:NAD(P)-dependent dehydrogenase (short-subunit alcohol dehydrogenase family)